MQLRKGRVPAVRVSARMARAHVAELRTVLTMAQIAERTGVAERFGVRGGVVPGQRARLAVRRFITGRQLLT
jgi:hypothetical protein